MTDTEEIPGDYDSLDGIKERATALGNPVVAALVDRAEERVYYDADVNGYRIEAPDTDPKADELDVEMLFHIGLLTGAALEREYPAPEDGWDNDPGDSLGSETENA